LSYSKKRRLAVVSPFLDKGHGTEGIIIAWIEQLTNQFEVHVYSQQVNDVDLTTVTWHRIPKLPGPHIFNYLWWFVANHLWRSWDRHVNGLRHDCLLSPGVNCLDADVVSVHVLFAQYLASVKQELKFSKNPIRSWPALIHRRVYYRLIIFLERRVYKNPDTLLILIARKTASDLARLYHRRDRCIVMYLGLDHHSYNPERREELRAAARTDLGLSEKRFAVLMVGNNWVSKGIRVLFEALIRLRELPIDLLIVGRENPSQFRALAAQYGLEPRVHFLPPRNDVEFYYAAADAYAGPSLEDTYALPPVEAMACGLPTIVSSENGACEVITDGVDGLILRDPRDAAGLAAMIRGLYEDELFRTSLGRKAADTAHQFIWERNGRELSAILSDIIARKTRPAGETQTQEL
jgi:UDP-glucose:(heptosyl)LPS alpha-1,3-glucosyltransferase